MENEYAVTVTNKFMLALDESEDPLEVLKVREQEKEAKKKERISEKENKSKQQQQQQQQDGQKVASNKTPKNRVIKDAQQPPSKVQDVKKDQVDKKPVPPRASGGDRNVKFSGESREERNNRRNREEGDRTLRGQGEFRRGPPGEGRETRETREFKSSTDAQRTEYGGERRPRGGIRNMGRGPRGGPRSGRAGFDNRGKREFDRQSGSDKTGIKPVDKKDGAGSHNWGTHNDEIEESLNQESQEWAEKSEIEAPPATEVKNGETTTETTVEEKPAEEETRELTLDEWKALRSNRQKPQYNLRKAGEGEDLSRWKKMYALEKKKEGNEEEEDEEEEYDAAAEYPQRVGRQKRVLGIEIQFSDSRRGSGGRGRGNRGRGDRVNGRGFGNRGAPRDGDSRSQNEQRSPRSRQNAPKVDDENDFPSLG